MADLTLEAHQQCSSVEQGWNYGGYSQLATSRGIQCTCKGFKFRKTCKHVAQVHESMCTWNSAYDEPQLTEGVCPRCGKSTRPVLVGA